MALSTKFFFRFNFLKELKIMKFYSVNSYKNKTKINEESEKTTHFGFKTVKESEKVDQGIN